MDTLDDPYARIARWYDAEHDAFDDDVQFYCDLAAGAGPAVLEVGCGTGRATVALARIGRSVTGIDCSAAMLTRCRERLAAEPAAVRDRVRLMQADAAALPEEVGGPFSLALIALNTFAHFLTPDQRLSVLSQLRQRLVPGGRLVLDVDLQGPRRLLEAPGHLWLLGIWSVPAAGAASDTGAAGEADAAGEGPVQVAHFASATPARGAEAVVVTHFYDEQGADGVVRRTTSRMTLALLGRGEVEMTLRQAGYAVEAVYGSYELDAYEPGAERAIFVAHTEPAGR